MDPSLFAELRAAAAAVADAPDADGVRAAALRGSLAVLGLKAHNRVAYEGLEAQRQSTAAAKQALEKTNLQLQNLQYEKCHYAKEIQTCLDFRSAVSDADVGLIPEADFLRSAPPEFNPAGGSAADPHACMLNRLAHELAVRKELGVRLQELKAKKKAQQETLTGRRKLILALATELKAIKAATVPVSKLVEVADRSAVHLLPAALRALFAALDGVAQPASEDRRFVLSVQGSPDLTAEAEPAAEEAAAEAAEPGEAKDEEDDGETGGRRNAKRARTGDGVHPMSVLLELHARGSRQAAVVFEFLPSRGLVVPRVEDGDAALLDGILGESFADAAGGEEGEAAPSPTETAAQALVLSWAQKLAGIELEGAADAAHAAAVVAALFAAASRL